MARTKQTARRSTGGKAHKIRLNQYGRKAVPKPKIKRRVKQGTKALREIRKLQKETSLLIPMLPFARLVREIMYDASRKITQIQAEALGAIQEAAEAYIIEIFEASVHCTVHRQRVTAIPKDVRLALKLRKEETTLL